MNKKQLSDLEKGKILAYSDCGLSLRDIGKKLGRHHGTIGKFLQQYKKSGNYQRNPGSGRKRSTTALQDQQIVRAAKRQRKITAQELQTKFKN